MVVAGMRPVQIMQGIAPNVLGDSEMLIDRNLIGAIIDDPTNRRGVFNTHGNAGQDFTVTGMAVFNRLGVKTLFIEPGSPWENGYVESFNGKMRDELLNREIFTTLEEAKVLIEQWRREYNQVRPHSSLGYRPPAPEANMSIALT
jgi:hypothetical protein